MASPGDRFSEVRRSEASLMTSSLTSIDLAGDGFDQTDGPAKRAPKRNSRPEWEFTYEKTSNLMKELKKTPEFNNIRVQLNDQLKNLDGRLEIQQGIVSEFHDIFRRRAEIEANYSKELDKLAKLITNRNKEHKQKRDGWQIFSSVQLWEQLVSHTKKTSRDHAALSDIYTCHIVQRCNQINEDLQRIYKKCREIGYEIHEEVLKVLHELHTAMKTHHNYQTEFRTAESKLQMLEKQRSKLLASVPPEKQEKHRRLRQLEKEHAKRKAKFDEARLKATKARNEYLLCMEAANSSIQRYFVEDLSDIIDCMDFGFHQSLNRAVMMHSNGLDQIRRSLQQEIDALSKSLGGLDSRLDKQKFFEYNNTAFMIPKKFEYSPVRRDESESLVQKPMLDELEMRKQKLKDRIASLNLEREEIGKSMDSAEKSLQEIVGCTDWDTTRFFIEEDRNAHKEPEAIIQKQKADRQEVEDFYVAKFREYVLNSNRVARLQAKYEHIRVTLGDQTSQPQDGGLTLTRRLNTGKRRRIGKAPRQGAPKLFGGSLEEYLEEINVDIPPVIKSCVRVINLFGLHHHGIFRVSGSQVEIAHIRDAFERGDDPLADVTDASDINSVAGVLKLYLRELREPLFPIQYFEHFMELAQLESKHEFVVKVRDMVKTWPRPIFVVMRYLFAFLNHLSEFSDENMMDPYNLAICFGPTLVPVPDHKDQVQYQNLVNELIKNFIIFHEDIFPTNVPGTAYEKYLTDDIYPEDPPIEDSPTDISREDDIDDASTYIDDDSVFREDGERDDPISLDLFGKSEAITAQALYDFNARSSREVDFRKGDSISLFKQVSGDWWRGSVNGKEGLIPDKYIMLTMRGEDENARERLESYRSDHERRHRAASISEASTIPLDQKSKSRTSSSSSQETTPSSRAPRGHSAHAPSSSPASSSRRNTVTSTADKPQISPNYEYEQRTPRSLTGSLSSPGSSTQRPSKNISTAQAIAVAASTASSPMFQQTGAQNNGSQPASSTVINVTGEQRKQSISSIKSAQGKLPPKFHEEDTMNIGSSKNTLVGNTHIIKVSGPVTNLDETVLSANIGMDGSLMASTISEHSTTSTTSANSSTAATGIENRETGMGPRSRLPLSPSMEARLSDDSTSQDSLASTGSNQELKTQLDSTLAEVEAITSQLEKQKLPNGNEKQRSPSAKASNIEINTSTSPSQQPAPPKPRRLSKDMAEHQSKSRRSSEKGEGAVKSINTDGTRKNSEETGARARNPVRKNSNSNTLPHLSNKNASSDNDKVPKVTPRSTMASRNESGTTKPLLITQNSWASRDQGMNSKSATASGKSLQNKRTTSPKSNLSDSPPHDTPISNVIVGRAQLSTTEPRKASLASNLSDHSNGDIHSFSNSRSAWERRASSQSTSGVSSLTDNPKNGSQSAYNMSASVEGQQQIGGGVGPNPVSVAFQLQRGGFRNNRDFWEQRGAMRQKQTPDLVIDLPVSSLSTSPNRTQSSSPPSSASSISVASANTAAVAPLPRPRKSISPADDSAANIDSDDKDRPRANMGKPSAKPRKL